MPRHDIQAVSFLENHAEYDGRGVVIAIFDTGVDPGAAALQTTPDGRPKILNVLDCTGSGDVDTSTTVSESAGEASGFKTDEKGGRYIRSLRGAWLRLGSDWASSDGVWHVGCRPLFELVPKSLATTIRADRKRAWMARHRALLADATAAAVAAKTKSASEDDVTEAEARVALLLALAEKTSDAGPILDAVVWRDDAGCWRAALDTSELEGGVALEDFVPMTDFKLERQFASFSASSACNFAVNVYDDGAVLSIVVDAGSHGTHVAGIAAAHDPDYPALNGVAPGAQIISCKIGDTRLGSMETAQGLYRALAAVLAEGVDVINMSYGESTATPNAGRFVELAEELVHEHGVVFVASAGNSGPGVSSVGAPGGTSSAILAIGAWVSPEAAVAGHAVREPPREGQPYTWSSRGPSPDGDLGVTLCAPGCAVAPVPRWTRQRRQLMNGTSMASPCAAGAVALILSGLKAEFGVHEEGPRKGRARTTPAALRKALIATCLRSAWDADSVLAQGAGLLQVADAYQALRTRVGDGERERSVAALDSARLAADAPWRVEVHRTDDKSPAFYQRGVYLRSQAELSAPTTWQITVAPWFAPDDVSSRLDLEVHAVLSCDDGTGRCAFVRCPGQLLICASGRTFEIEVDPRSLPAGFHVAELRGRLEGDDAALFSVPITVAVPVVLSSVGESTSDGIVIAEDTQGALARPFTFAETLMLNAGVEERRLLAVPPGATWAELVLRVTADEPKTLVLRGTQLRPQTRFDDGQWRRSVTVAGGQVYAAAFAVAEDLPLELVVAQMWNSLGGCLVDLDIAFHGLRASPAPPGDRACGVVLDGAAGVQNLVVGAPLRAERLDPKATLDALCIPARPKSAELVPLKAPRDAITRGRVAHQLTLVYELALQEAGTVTPRIPRFNRLVYDGILDGQMLVVRDANKRILGWCDIYTSGIKLPAGTCTVQLALRHTDAALLQTLRDLCVVFERRIEPALQVPVYATLAACVTGGPALTKEVPLCHGTERALFLGNVPADKLPKDAAPGRLLRGHLRLGAVTVAVDGSDRGVSRLALEYLVPPTKLEKKPNSGGAGSEVPAPEDPTVRYSEALLDASVAYLKSLADDDGGAERAAYETLWTQVARQHPKSLPLLLERLDRLQARKDCPWTEKIAVADEILEAIDHTALAVYLAQKMPEEGPLKDKRKKEFEQQQSALIKALVCKATRAVETGANQEMPKEMEDVRAAFAELRKWVDLDKETKYALLQAQRFALAGHHALAIQSIDKALEDSKLADKHKELTQQRVSSLHALGYECWAELAQAAMWVAFPPALNVL